MFCHVHGENALQVILPVILITILLEVAMNVFSASA